MTIYLEVTEGGNLKVRQGCARLRRALSVFGYANVVDVKTDEQFRVHEVHGQLVVLPESADHQEVELNSSALEQAI
jgi:hypothetical protein